VHPQATGAVSFALDMVVVSSNRFSPLQIAPGHFSHNIPDQQRDLPPIGIRKATCPIDIEQIGNARLCFRSQRLESSTDSFSPTHVVISDRRPQRT
jgi:hypothetical protein